MCGVVYDILVLHPSFSFGGMENPCLTFATLTLLSVDKSNANVIAHEIAHSWTGNLVTNSDFEHFWLNEGCTVVFTERKILRRMRGEPGREGFGRNSLPVLFHLELGHLLNRLGHLAVCPRDSSLQTKV